MNEHPWLRLVLRKASHPSDTARRLAKKFGYLPYMVERYLEMLGPEGTLRLLEANEQPLPQYIRCNDYLIDCGELASRLSEKGVLVERDPRFSPLALRVVKAHISIGATHEYLMGYYYVQGPASMAIVHALEIDRGRRYIDLAAAPGGKATQILQLARDTGVLIAVEKSRKRIRSLRANLQRMRFTHWIAVRADSTRLELPPVFDGILLDAPSTGEGIIRKDPSRKRSRTPGDLARIHRLQLALLRKAVDLARPGASIVYAACTLAPEEGEMVIDALLRSDVRVDVASHGLPISGGITSYFGLELDSRVSMCGRFWPHIHGTEGFFVCKLRKRRE